MKKGVHYNKFIIDEIRVPSPFLRDLLRDHRSKSSMQFPHTCDRLQDVLDGVHAIDEK